jgi:hypothetical protein
MLRTILIAIKSTSKNKPKKARIAVTASTKRNFFLCLIKSLIKIIKKYTTTGRIGKRYLSKDALKIKTSI